MEALILPRGARARNAKAGAAFGIVTGILVLVLFLYPAPSGTVQQQLTNFNAGAWEIIGILDVLILLAAIPFAAYLRSVLEARSPGTASAGAILFIVGVVFGAGTSLIQASSMSTLSTAYTGASSAAADRAAALLAATLLSNLSDSLASLVVLEAGIVLLSVAMLNSKVFANWVADVGVASAMLVILVLALSPFLASTSFVGFVLFIAYLVLLDVWVFGSAGYLLRTARIVPVAAPAPT